MGNHHARTTGRLVLGTLLIACLLSACSTSGQGTLLLRPGTPPDLRIKRVAIIPNRQKTMVPYPIHWRLSNWELVRDQFAAHGYEVVDRAVADSAARRYLDLDGYTNEQLSDVCNALNVDALIIPEYNTTSAHSDALIFTTNRYIALARFDVFTRETRDIVAVIEAMGVKTYLGRFVTSIGLVGLAATANSNDDASRGLSLSALALGIVHDFSTGMQSPASHWEEAFAHGIADGLEPFFRKFGSW